MLARLLETCQKIQLHIEVGRVLGKLNLAPGLRPGPSSCLPVTQDLLIEVNDLQVRRDSFKAIRLINFCIDMLQGIQGLLHGVSVIAQFFLLTEDVRLQVKQCSGILLALNGSPRQQLRRDGI